MSNKRKPREGVVKEEFDLLKPLNILKLGVPTDDPCFGKHHDLLAEECRICGDSEFCSVVMLQTMKMKVLKEESINRFKDNELADFELNEKIEKAKKMIVRCRERGLKKSEIIQKVWDRLNLPKDEIKKLL